MTMPARFSWSGPVAGLAVVAALHGGEARAQGITVDGRLSPAQTLAGPNYAIRAELGRQMGGNLFHSFGRFGLNAGESATFSGPRTVANVIGRVTGGAASAIDGTVSSAIPGANLYLINPAGVVFGPNASVDVSGAFHASSADYLRMRDGARFQATNPDASTLSAAPPEAFGFLSPNPARVEVNGTTLQAAPGRALGLVGGPVTISGGALSVPAGTVHIASAAGPGEIPVDPRAGPAPTVARSGAVRVERSLVSVSDAAGLGSGGSVFVRAGTIDVAASAIDADNHGSGRGGEVSLRGDGAVTIRDQATPDQPIVRARALATGQGASVNISTAAGGTVVVDAATVEVGSEAAGDGGALSITGGALAVRNGAAVTSIVQARGNGGPVSIGVDGDVSVTAGATIGSYISGRGQRRGGDVSVTAGGNLVIDSGASQQNTGIVGLSVGSVDAGSVAVAAQTIVLHNYATISSNAPASARAGAVVVAATGDLALVSVDPDREASISALNPGAGNGGSVLVTARDIILAGNTSILSGADASGNGGAVAVGARGNLVLAGAAGLPARIASVSTGSGNAGTVEVAAQGGIGLGNNASIGSFARESSGAVTVRAEGSLLLDGRQAAVAPQILASTGGTGDAGPVTVSAGNITIRGDAGIRSITRGNGSGRGSGVAVAASGSILIDSDGAATLDAARITTSTEGSGNAGSLVVTAQGDITLKGEARIGSQVGRTGTGNGGAVTVHAGGNLLLDGTQGTSLFGSRIIANTFGAGDAGPVLVNAGNIAILGNAGVTSLALGNSSGRAQNVTVAASGSLLIDGEGAGTSLGSSISASTSGSGSAGSIDVRARNITLRNRSFITSSGDANLPDENGQFAPRAGGAGGNVTVAADGALTLSGGSHIDADTFGSNPGGAVTVSAASMRLVGNSRISSFSIDPSSGSLAAGSAGAVTVKAGDLTLSEGGAINSDTSGAGAGGQVVVSVDGSLAITGSPDSNITGISADSLGDGRAGTVTVSAGTLTLARGGLISTSTSGPGDAGDIAVTVGGALAINGTSGALTGITATNVSPSGVDPSSVRLGNAGNITIRAAEMSITGEGVSVLLSGTTGSGRGGDVAVDVTGGLTIIGPSGSGSLVGISAETLGRGRAGNIRVNAGTLALAHGGVIASGTRGPGDGGETTVRVRDALTIDGIGDGPFLTRIESRSTGTGNAGSIAVSAPRITLRDGAAISTEALSANGGNINIGPGDLLYLQNSRVTTSVNGALGSGGNITIDPRLVVLDRGVIQANAVGGNGGNVLIGGQLLQSASGSAVTATSQLGVSGAILIAGPPVNLNGSLVVLASELRAAAALLREGCAARGGNPQSSLVVAGRGGRRQGAAAEATLPALYIAHRPVRADDGGSEAWAPPVRTSVGLSSRCE